MNDQNCSTWVDCEIPHGLIIGYASSMVGIAVLFLCLQIIATWVCFLQICIKDFNISTEIEKK